MAYQRKDSWYRKARQEGYRSRAAYKLLEIDQKHGLLQQGLRVVDLGCAPGGWMQVAAEAVGQRGRVVGMDRLAMQPLEHQQVAVLRGDVTSEDACERLEEALGGRAQLVLSDMAPDTSGIGFADHVRSVELVMVAASIATRLLEPGGTFVAKVFDGPELNKLLQDLRAVFKTVRRIRLRSTRKGSRELYLMAGPSGGHRKDGANA
jgi:23S rRNA (uridine2552-2'-O)-methyltransferase